MKQDEYAVEETADEYAINRRHRPGRIVPKRVKTETVERLRQAEEIERGRLPPRQPERQ